MTYLTAHLHILGVQLRSWVGGRIDTHNERGAVSVEQVLWIVFLVGLAGLVFAGVTNLVNANLAKIN